jgi:hypothetical protein
MSVVWVASLRISVVLIVAAGARLTSGSLSTAAWMTGPFVSRDSRSSKRSSLVAGRARSMSRRLQHVEPGEQVPIQLVPALVPFREP